MSRLEVVTEFLSAPEPAKERVVVERETDPARRSLMAVPDVTDDRLSFGEYAMGPGRAFRVGAEEQEALGVAKRWEIVEGRTVLFESVGYESVAGMLAGLPDQASNGTESGKTRRVASAVLQLPRRGEMKRAQASLKHGLEVQVERFSGAETEPSGRVALASGIGKTAGPGSDLGERKPASGLVLDYLLLPSSLTNYTFTNGTTYLAMGQVWLWGTTTFEGSSVIKYTNGMSASLRCIFEPIFNSGPYNPVVFTAIDDHTVGSVLSTNTLGTNYYASPALWVWHSSSNLLTLHDFRVAHAEKGVELWDLFLEAPVSSQLRHAQFVRCQKAVEVTPASYEWWPREVYLQNVLMHSCSNGVYGRWYHVYGQHLTTDQCTQLAVDWSQQQYGVTSRVDLVNSLVVATGTNVVMPVTLDTSAMTSDTNVFERVGAGWHYLPVLSPYRRAGSTEIESSLADEMRSKTTAAPLVIGDLLALGLVQKLIPIFGWEDGVVPAG